MLQNMQTSSLFGTKCSIAREDYLEKSIMSIKTVAQELVREDFVTYRQLVRIHSTLVKGSSLQSLVNSSGTTLHVFWGLLLLWVRWGHKEELLLSLYKHFSGRVTEWAIPYCGFSSQSALTMRVFLFIPTAPKQPWDSFLTSTHLWLCNSDILEESWVTA